MLNFTVGPVMSSGEVLNVASQSSPYFRTPEFSEIMLENERMVLEMLHAPAGSRCVFLTASGTGVMESCVMNILNGKDKVLIVNGGSFGQRFVDMCRLHNREFTEIKCEFGKGIEAKQLEPFAGKSYTALLVNMHETSSGVLYNMEMISEFCKENQLLLIVDAISAFIADELDMAGLGAAAVITGSQKALAVQPGISLAALAPAALRRIEKNPELCMYLSMKESLKNGVRGQTPFTPAVTVLLQIHKRLKQIKSDGGIEAERNRIQKMAHIFRDGIKDLPFELVAESPSNAVTSVHPTNVGAKRIVEMLKDEYQIWVCPNGGKQADEIFRVGHIGNMEAEDVEVLLDALHDIDKRGVL